MLRRIVLLLAALVAAFGFGLFTANYKTFPWTVIQPAGQHVAELLRAAGLLPPLPVYLPPPPPADDLLPSGLLNFDITTANADSPFVGGGGGMSLTPGGLLIARAADGSLGYFDRRSDELRTLPYQLPELAVDLYDRDFGDGRKLMPGFVRYHDVEVVPGPDGPRLYVSYNHHDPARDCFSIRLDRADLPADWETATSGALVWQTVLEAAPCLPPANDRAVFGGNQGGGRIVVAPEGGILFTLGDLEYDGFDSKTPAVSQLEGSHYGRVLRIGPDDEITEVSRGHRNPQGLAIDGAGRIWMAEHAAMGGDELNLILAGRNYGWPNVTLGVMYTDIGSDEKSWWPNPRQGRHDGYEPPRHAWMPSIAPSSLAIVSGISPRWDGDLLVGTLGGMALHRLRLEGTHVLYDETIPMKRRVRDLAIADGRIYLLSDEGHLSYLTPREMDEGTAPPQTPAGALAELGCASCHANPRAPQLSQVYGRDIGAQAGVAYSDALLQAEGTWTDESLAVFLASPQTFASGTTMPETGLGDAQIATIIDELRAMRPADD